MDNLTGPILIVIGVAIGLWLLFSIVHIVREYERLVGYMMRNPSGPSRPRTAVQI